MKNMIMVLLNFFITGSACVIYMHAIILLSQQLCDLMMMINYHSL